MPVSTLFMLLRWLNPIFSKRVASSTANYLNRRRETRSGKPTPPIEPDTLDPDTLKTLCPPPPKPETRIIYTISRWHLLSSGLIGAGLTVIVGLIFLRSGK